MCFACRVAVRRETWRHIACERPHVVGGKGAERVRCPECRAACRFLGPTIEIPPKRHVKRWRLLELGVLRARAGHVERRARAATAAKHELERTIRALRQRKPTRDRDRLLRNLEAKLDGR